MFSNTFFAVASGKLGLVSTILVIFRISALRYVYVMSIFVSTLDVWICKVFKNGPRKKTAFKIFEGLCMVYLSGTAPLTWCYSLHFSIFDTRVIANVVRV